MSLVKWIIPVILYFNFCFSQDTLTFEKFFSYVLQYHPVIQNTVLSTEQANKAYLLKAKGQFDPKINYNLQSKYFNDKNYFNFYEAELKIPTYIGADLNATYNYAAGLYLNSEQYIPASGLYSLGASFPILRNLWYDERRFNLQSARLFNNNSKIFLNAQILNVLENIMDSYWDFYEKYNTMLLFKEIVNNAYARYINVVNATKTGEIPSIDTLDAGNQYQKFYLDYQKAILDFQNSRYNLLIHLNQRKDTNFIAPAIPEKFLFENIDTTFLIQKNPEILSYQLKLKQLNYEKKLRIEFLKPQLNIKYNFLLQPFSEINYYPLNTNNYKWGIDFSFPLFLRKERADLKLTNLKISQTKNELAFKQSQIENKIKIYYNNYLNYYQQLQYGINLTQRFYQMLQAEIKLFQTGESNLFTVNTREIYYLQSKQKVIELSQKYLFYKNWLNILKQYSTGI
ncbi:MAG: TolC family protein [Bacteroidia bacterium]|nr:TolC family protein [Bacteroidia bacterium]